MEMKNERRSEEQKKDKQASKQATLRIMESIGHSDSDRWPRWLRWRGGRRRKKLMKKKGITKGQGFSAMLFVVGELHCAEFSECARHKVNA